MSFEQSKIFGRTWSPSKAKRKDGIKVSSKKKEELSLIKPFHVRQALKHLKTIHDVWGPLFSYIRTDTYNSYFANNFFSFAALHTPEKYKLEGSYKAMSYGQDTNMNTEMGALILLMSIINRLGGTISIPVEATDDAYADQLYVAQDVAGKDYVLSTKTGSLNGQKALRISHGVQIKGAVEIDIELAIKAMLLQNGVGPKTLARVSRKHFEQAALYNLVVNPDENFDEYVYISLEKKNEQV